MAKILVVEDEIHLQIAIEFIIQSIGHEVIKAFNKQDALTEFQKSNPDLIILDIMMPESSNDAGNIQPNAGLDVFRAIHKQNDQVPIIILSIKAKSIDITDDIKADAFLTKPFSTEDLINCVHRLLNKEAESEDEEKKYC